MPEDHHQRAQGAKSRPSTSTKLSHTLQATSNLRDTLSSFGDDVVRYKGHNYDLGVNPSDSIPHQTTTTTANTNDHDLDQQGHIQFERVPSHEVGVRSNRWRKAIVASIFTSPTRKSKSLKKIQDFNNLHQETDNTGEICPLFWGVGQSSRDKVSMLTLQLLLHEVACFASCVLLGWLTLQAFQNQGQDSLKSEVNWVFSRIYGSISTLMVALTSLGFLLRMDTTDKKCLLTIPIYIIPTIVLSSCVYLVKACELQGRECLQYEALDEVSRKQIHLTQNCHLHNLNGTNLNGKFRHISNQYDTAILVLRIVPLVSCLMISLFLFTFRHNFYLSLRFGVRRT